MKNNINEIILIVVAVLACIWVSIQSDASDTIKIMIIDTGVDLSWPEIKSHVKEDYNYNYNDRMGHGTAMAGLVLKDVCSQIELISCKYYDISIEHTLSPSNECFKRALKENIKYINYSSNGPDYDYEEYYLLKDLIEKGAIITLAAGNDRKNLTPTFPCYGSFPACYLLPNTFVVQNINVNNEISLTSNKLTGFNVRSEDGNHVPVLLPNKKTGYITGTSPATAIYMNKLLKNKCWELNK